MLYKTVILSLMESHPEFHRRLRMSRNLLKEVDRYSDELRNQFMELCQSLPQDAASELALAELEARIAQEAAR